MKPLIIFDLETTGTDPVRDRIIQFAGWKMSGEDYSQREQMNFFLNPGIPIPASATAIHGITNDMVAEEPIFADIALQLRAFLACADYAGFWIKQFDIPLLSEEFARVEYSWPGPGFRVLDACEVFKRKERRDLAAAMRFYCGQELIGGHEGLNDVAATFHVLMAQMARYPDLGNVDAYADFCHDPKALDLAGKIILNDEGIAVYNIGKDKGKSVKDNPGFGIWMINHDFPANTKNIIRSLLPNHA